MTPEHGTCPWTLLLLQDLSEARAGTQGHSFEHLEGERAQQAHYT